MIVFILALLELADLEMDEVSQRHLNDVSTPLYQLTELTYHTCPTSFIVIDGLRTLEEQHEYLKNGVSQTLNSKHLTGNAIDFVVADWDWEDIESFEEIGQCFKDTAVVLDLDITWGGDWVTLRDYGHIQLNSNK